MGHAMMSCEESTEEAYWEYISRFPGRDCPVTRQGLKGSDSTGISPQMGASRKRGERNLRQSTNKNCARVLQSPGGKQGSAHQPLHILPIIFCLYLIKIDQSFHESLFDLIC